MPEILAPSQTRRFVIPATILSCILWTIIACAMPALAQETEDTQKKVEIDWERGPTNASISHLAEIEVPEGYVFANAEDTRKLMEVMQNPVSGDEVGFLGPESLEWFVVFEFSEVGYVRDDDQDALDADKLLRSIQNGTENSNKLRRERGWATIQVLGWEQPPHYDAETHNLVWAIRAESDGKPLLNYNTRLLGRRGVMRVSLVVDNDKLTEVLPVYKDLMQTYAFQSGQRYAEYRSGDKVAKYGLAALITGGAAVAAVKTGLLAKFGKLLLKLALPVLIAVGAVCKKVFGRKRPVSETVDHQ